MTDAAKKEAERNAANPKKPRKRVRATPPCKDLKPPPDGWRTPTDRALGRIVYGPPGSGWWEYES